MKKRNTFRTVMYYVGKHKVMFTLSILLALVSSLSALYVPVIFGSAIDMVKEQNRVGLTHKLLLIVIVVALTAMMQWLMALINNKITYEVTRDLRNDIFNKLLKLPFNYLDTHQTGDLVSRMVTDVDTFADGLLLGFTQAFTGIVTIVGTLIYMCSLSRITTVVVVFVTPLSLFLARYIAKNTHDMFIMQSVTKGEQTSIIDEMIGNEKVVKSFGYEERAIERFDEVNERLSKVSLKALFFSSIVNPGTRFVNAICYALVALVGAYRVMGGFITIGNLSTLLAYATQYTKPFNEISGVVTELQNAFACASRAFELLYEDNESDLEISYDVKYEGEVNGDICVSGVDFSYVPDKPLIEDFNIDVARGERIAIVGPTGCGKTTLINLLMRFYDVKGGHITVEGEDITSLSRQRHRSRFGMVLQDTWIKNGTVLDNIRIGNKNATREECIKAAMECHADSFIRRLPEGYDTVLSEDGSDLSVGQKQLLCISRVMLALPPILILDEATSSIDTRTELKIQEAFHKLMKGRTSFIVAHRLSTIMDADKIIVMKDGHIIELGTHEELLAKGGFYSELFKSQFMG
ncbi:MAG: ABC transporter ATP-binding protein [Lachnospiraceae bacterium]|nr:ABC transporter ATP-binding protein [Lachnospiraceae bacterium]